MIETKRLIIDIVNIKDCNDLLEIHNSELILKYNPMPAYQYQDMLKDIENANNDFYTIRLKNNKIIGAIFKNKDYLRYRINACSLSYYIASDYHRNGYMYEALSAYINSIKNEVELISARVFEENIASRRLLEKLGFSKEGCLYKGVKDLNNCYHNDMLYALY